MKKYKFYKKNKDNFLKCKYELETEKTLSEIKTSPEYWFLNLNECVPKQVEN
jgi:hypothetical protein